MKIIQVDAFTNQPFSGNPAAVCVLSETKPDTWLQNVAAEMNLSETAFLLPQIDGFNLRWFTPTVEVDLCGHATLASAHVLWSEGYLTDLQAALFHTTSGLLIAHKKGEWIELNFPASLSQKVDVPPQLIEALGITCQSVWQNSLGYLVELESAELVTKLQPNFELLKNLSVSKITVTSKAEPSSEYDFISRFFAPALGINEDPVTGSAHCSLAPFWRERLHKDEFLAYQASKRGGVVKVCYEMKNC
jgi:PhzF family phenazine biosynthesis protein